MNERTNGCCIEVASTVLEIPVSLIHVTETSNVTVPNASPSASSLCTELYGMAVVVSRIFPGLPWIWISMDISMDISTCGYQT